MRWQEHLTEPIRALPIGALGRVSVGAMNSTSPPAIKPGLSDAHALNAQTGTLLWSYPCGLVTSLAPDPAPGLVYVGTNSPRRPAKRWSVREPNVPACAGHLMGLDGLLALRTAVLNDTYDTFWQTQTEVLA
jgi:outer membrane protein assembly factor BamB